MDVAPQTDDDVKESEDKTSYDSSNVTIVLKQNEYLKLLNAINTLSKKQKWKEISLDDSASIAIDTLAGIRDHVLVKNFSKENNPKSQHSEEKVGIYNGMKNPTINENAQWANDSALTYQTSNFTNNTGKRPYVDDSTVGTNDAPLVRHSNSNREKKEEKIPENSSVNEAKENDQKENDDGNGQYTKSDRKLLCEFMDMLSDPNGWTGFKNKNSSQDGMITEHKKGNNGVPVSRTTCELNYSVDATDFIELIYDKCVINQFYDDAKKGTISKKINKMKRLSQFQVKVKKLKQFDRDFLVKEIAFFVIPKDSNYDEFTLLQPEDVKKHCSQYQKHRMIYLLNSITSGDDYRTEMKNHTRGIMYGTGVCVENIGKNKAKISVIMEVNIGGNSATQYFGNTTERADQESRKLCHRTRSNVEILNTSNKTKKI